MSPPPIILYTCKMSRVQCFLSVWAGSVLSLSLVVTPGRSYLAAGGAGAQEVVVIESSGPQPARAQSTVPLELWSPRVDSPTAPELTSWDERGFVGGVWREILAVLVSWSRSKFLGLNFAGTAWGYSHWVACGESGASKQPPATRGHVRKNSREK